MLHFYYINLVFTIARGLNLVLPTPAEIFESKIMSPIESRSLIRSPVPKRPSVRHKANQNFTVPKRRQN